MYSNFGPGSINQPQSSASAKNGYGSPFDAMMNDDINIGSKDEAPAKLKKLDEINSKIVNNLNQITQLFDELNKDKPTINRIKPTIIDYVENLRSIESDILNEINYLSHASTGYPHEGSIYGSKKDYDLAKQRLNLITTQLNALRNSLESPLPLEDQSSN